MKKMKMQMTQMKTDRRDVRRVARVVVGRKKPAKMKMVRVMTSVRSEVVLPRWTPQWKHASRRC